MNISPLSSVRSLSALLFQSSASRGDNPSLSTEAKSCAFWFTNLVRNVAEGGDKIVAASGVFPFQNVRGQIHKRIFQLGEVRLLPDKRLTQPGGLRKAADGALLRPGLGVRHGMAQPHVVGNAGHKRFQPRVNGGAIRACGQRRGQFGRIPQQTLPDEGRFRASVADFLATRTYAGFQHPIRHQGCPLFHDQRAQGLGRNLFRSSAQGVFHSFQQCKSAGQRFQRHAFGKNIRAETCAQIGQGLH